MRIISGIAGGRKLAAPPGEKTRPTSDKLRGSLFNILGLRTQEAWVLDVFVGTGALAMEAMSRGASRAVIIEKDRAAWDVIQKNAQSVLGADFSERVDIIRGDYRAVLSRLEAAKYDMIFLDPPYRMLEAYGAALNLLRERGLLAEDAVVICERARSAQAEYPAEFEIYDTRLYGETAVDFLRERRILTE